MSMYQIQLVLGLLAIVFWGALAYRWLTGHTPSPIGQVAIVVGVASGLVILPFGSLRLLEVIDDGTWSVTGTLLRFVVVACGAVGLLATVKDR